MAGDDDRRRHLILSGITRTDRYKSPRQIIAVAVIPGRNRAQHAAQLNQALQGIHATVEASRQAQEATGLDYERGISIEFESFPDVELAFESLARERMDIELLNVRKDEQRTLATVFVPDGRLAHFEKLVREYLEERKDRRGRNRDHSNLINTIQNIRAASLHALWTDDPGAFPVDDGEVFWWEAWLPVRQDREATLASFAQLVGLLGLHLAPGRVVFPERTVVLLQASAAQMTQSMMILNSVAELRRAKETAAFFDALTPEEQREWVQEILDRTDFASAEADAPYVCLLDTGVNRGHPLLAPALDPPDMHSVEPGWGLDDTEGHGTGMAGLAVFGDLAPELAGAHRIRIDHRLESVKLLEHDGGNAGNPALHGYLTVEAISRPEIAAPGRSRVFSMAITARDNRDRGKPSAWSATIDRLASDADNQGQTPRLFVIAAGNVNDPNAWMTYPDSNATDGIHDPGQSWNALTVGAYTNLANITEADAASYLPVAPQGGLSPFSTTSLTWERALPLKPDVVFEGGNAAKDDLSAVWMPSLSLLTTNHLQQDRLLTTSNATSAATALASRMAAHLMAAYPELWPETVRALIVHSADWTDAMRTMFLPGGHAPSKEQIENLVRNCGFGVPSLDQALWSAADSLTLVVQESLHPFEHKESKSSMRDMQLHRLPWPLEELQALGEVQVQMRVTLSYFIEPNPSARGPRSRYRYESHGLRFEVKRPLESEADFLARINADARDEEYGTVPAGNDPDWILGKQRRHHGSLHSDVWTGTAAALASRGMIGVYPSMGWWRTRPKHQRANSPARYALLVSIRAPAVDVDLYSAIEAKIAQPVAIATGNVN